MHVMCFYSRLRLFVTYFYLLFLLSSFSPLLRSYKQQYWPRKLLSFKENLFPAIHKKANEIETFLSTHEREDEGKRENAKGSGRLKEIKFLELFGALHVCLLLLPGKRRRLNICESIGVASPWSGRNFNDLRFEAENGKIHLQSLFN